MSKYIVAIDVGGTFTDLIGYDKTTTRRLHDSRFLGFSPCYKYSSL
jgi:N-methylhydantoinase A/oxoprolinase/acetone carboxylase beta subunit